MASQLVLPDLLVTPDGLHRGVAVRIDNGKILGCERVSGNANPSPTHERVTGALLPGAIDLQVNGAGGRSVDEATDAALEAIARSAWQGGATAFLPTLITAPFDALLDQIAAVARWIREREEQPDTATPLGLHIEGPFLEAPGAHDPDLFVQPDPARVQAILTAGQDQVALVTLAPSVPGAPEAVAQLRRSGVAVALGHGADPAGFEACVDSGAELVTHLFNAMGPLHHREPGIAGRALDDLRILCPMIVDGAHIHSAMVRNAWRILGPDRTVLVSDAMPAAGMGDGTFSFGCIQAEVEDGVARDSQGRLAGSVLTMGQAIRNFLAVVPDASPWSVARATATNPARVLGRTDRGSIQRDTVARFTRIAPDGSVSALGL